jgi:hypothetical protein
VPVEFTVNTAQPDAFTVFTVNSTPAHARNLS